MSGYIKNNLVVDFDVNNINISDFSLQSKHKWNGTKFNDITINDYGLNQYDIGVSGDLKNGKTLNNGFLILERIGEPDFNGNISYTNYGMTIEDGPNIGKYIKSSGGYLNNPFKYHNYYIEYIPRIFNNGFTFETTLFVDNNTFDNTNNNSNIFLSLGVRAEDKFADSYSGNSIYITSEGATLDNSYKIYDISDLKENTQNINTVTNFLTKKDLFIKNNNQLDFVVQDLISDNFKLIYNGSLLVKDVDYSFDLRSKTITLIDIETNVNDTIEINYYSQADEDINLININLSEIDNYQLNKEYGIENNVISFKFDNTGRIGYRKINQDGILEEAYSENQAVYPSWNHILITFKPNNIDNINQIEDDCLLSNPRNGVLKIYVNGLLSFTKEDFIEPQFNPYPIDRSKQVGVPYNISWGGGFVGLKHSYNFNGNNNTVPYEINTNNQNLLIENNFDGYFNGGFQKLRIYDKFFTPTEYKINYGYESDYYNITYNKGGRLIQINNFST